jgi:hypothetical protein
MIHCLENSLISYWNYYSIILLSIPLTKDKKRTLKPSCNFVALTKQNSPYDFLYFSVKVKVIPSNVTYHLDPQSGWRQWTFEWWHWQIREEYNESECQNPRNVIYSTTAYFIYILLTVYIFTNKATHQHDSVTPLNEFSLASTQVMTRLLVVFSFTPTSYFFQNVSKIMYR